MSEEKQAEVGLEDANWGDPSGEGLTAGLDKFFDQEDEAKLKLAPEPEKVEVEAKEEIEAKEEVETEEKTEEKVADIMDEDFFPPEEKEEKEEKTDDFDDKAFEEQTDALTKGMEAKPGEKFKELRNELKEFKKKALESVVPEDTVKEIAALKLQIQEQEGLQARFDEMAGKSAKLQVESSKAYESGITKPAKALFEKADALAEAYQIDPSHVRAIIKESDVAKRDAMVEEFLSDVPAYNQARVIHHSEEFSSLLQKREDMFSASPLLIVASASESMSSRFSSLLQKREDMLSDADATISKGLAENIVSEQKALDEQRQVVQTIQGDIFEKYKDKIPGFMEDGQETAAFKQLKGKGLSIDFGKARARDQALAAFSGVVLPHAMQEISKLQKELSAYRDEDASAKKGSTSSGNSVKPSSVKREESVGFMDNFLKADFA